MPKRFSYYASLSAKDRATYRKSDEIGTIDLPDPTAFAPLAQGIAAALVTEDRKRTTAAAQALADAIMTTLQVSPVIVTVKSKRPRSSGGELHGLYTFDCDPPRIEVWMRTAAQKRVVAFKTFLRTLVHELMHHLDLNHLGLKETFHTEGFYRRESNLVRAMLPETFPRRRVAPPAETESIDEAPPKPPRAPKPPPTPKPPPAPKPPRAKKTARPRQLELFG